ncbi:hypothetical protein FRX31_025579 [Thalictrum thalictroides]|uniref:F-box/kelch-repeat protein n=1 Tax=Thalictrum thalictroides TaxID=46969 RepID=A0A7J6VIA4_THATH|nr:hypothetical protein FRX31_025579 [Thalictrum thalictroides]
MVTDLTPICTVPGSSRIGRGCASALLGSKLFMFGGCPEQRLIGCSDVFSVDSNNQFGWQKENFCMLAQRCYPVAAVTHGKIFIFGSNDCKTLPKPWAEVFDPNLNLFSPLPEPPLYVTQACGGIDITVVANGDTILLRMRDCLFSFDVITKSWGQLSTTSLSTRGYWSLRSATLDDVLFTYSAGRVRAYDLIKEKWFRKPVLDLAAMSDIPPIYIIHGYVVRIGTKTLCVVWYDEHNWHTKRSVGCVNFHVVKKSNSKGKSFLRAQVHSRSDYLIPTGYSFDDCLPL